MSIASRITSMENNIRNAYHGLESIGLDTSNVDKNIENISAVLDDFYDTLPKVSGTGTNIQLTPTKKGRITSQINGDTFQQTYTGKNLFNKTDYTTITTGNNGNATNVKTTDKITITTGDTSASGIYITKANLISYITNYDSSQTYYVSMDLKANRSITIQMGCDTRPNFTIGTTLNRIYVETKIDSNGLVIYSKEATVGDTIEITNIMVSTSSDTTYEKYVGGTASPNPLFSQNIESVTGTQNINVCGKNRLNLASGTSSINNTTIKITNDIINFKVDGTTTYASYGIDGELRKANYGNYIPWNNKILKAGTYTLSVKYVSGSTTTAHSSGNMLNATIFARDIGSSATYPNNNIARTYVETTDNSVTFTIAEDQEINIVIGLYSSSQPTIDINFKVQLEKNSSSTTYEAYNGNDYTIHLGNIELFEDDYITGTPNNWSIVKQIVTKTLNGGESWGQSSTYTNQTILSTYLVISDYKASSVFLSDKFTYLPTISSSTAVEYISTGGSSIRIGIFKSRLATTDLTGFKTWLSNNNVKLAYELATPTTTPITDTTLINDLNNFYYALSKNGETNISVDGNLPIILDVSALKGEE